MPKNKDKKTSKNKRQKSSKHNSKSTRYTTDVCVFILGNAAEVREEDIRTQFKYASDIWGIDFRPNICDLRTREGARKYGLKADATIARIFVPLQVRQREKVFRALRKGNCGRQTGLAVFYINAQDLKDGKAIGNASWDNKGTLGNIVMTYDTFQQKNMDILAHEFGHALLVNARHLNDKNNIMYPSGTIIVPPISQKQLRAMTTSKQRAKAYKRPYIYRI
ncbi:MULTISPECIES: hypothetical protein [Peribacillus]|uniref:hypothetical protein n=1 Tax=Peribacillus TaxID=2675229 RepID=UPI001F4D3E5F|nr:MULTISPECIES: hypothetical protein [unclassified Peribacillus]MCK1981485.1 hypothetical protein [Peribacillus sp. Aquil_B1]MCK2006768.1 hypothetical protein [Peribacillus sp. Aquil_B8]